MSSLATIAKGRETSGQPSTRAADIARSLFSIITVCIACNCSSLEVGEVLRIATAPAALPISKLGSISAGKVRAVDIPSG